MPGDPKECRKHARNCLRIAEASAKAEITRTFVDLAHSWTRIRARPGKRPSSDSGRRGYGKCRFGRNGTRHDPRCEHSHAKKRASAQLIGRRSASFRARAGREIPARKRPHLRLDGGALAMCDVAAWVIYHIARANVNIASCDTMAKNPAPRTSNDRLRHQRTVPLRFVCGHESATRCINSHNPELQCTKHLCRSWPPPCPRLL